MELVGLLLKTAEALRAVRIPFMLTGSVAAAYHGAVRATMDIDLVVDPSRRSLKQLVTLIEGSGAYVSEDAATEALAHRTMFNVIDPQTGWKANLIIRKDRPFSETELARRLTVAFDGITLSIATLEDVILSKLEWAKLVGSARQMEDVATLLSLRSADLDNVYLDKWVADLGLERELERARSLVTELPPPSPGWR